MRVISHVVLNDEQEYPREYLSNEVILVHNLFSNYKPGEIYTQLLKEIKSTPGQNKKDLFKKWHGDTHLIADDNYKIVDWKGLSPTFNMIINRIKTYFNVDINATRFNFYENNDQFKPLHHDAAAIKPHIAKKQNITIAAS